MSAARAPSPLETAMRPARVTFQPSKMNATEARFARDVLEPRRLAGEVAWWGYEALTLRLGHRCSYCPDFIAVLADGSLSAVEVKARWSHGGPGYRGDARAKLVAAASAFPWIAFAATWPAKAGGWEREDIQAHDGPRIGNVEAAAPGATTVRAAPGVYRELLPGRRHPAPRRAPR